MNDYSDLTPSGLAHELGNQLQKLSRLQAEADQIPGVQENIERLRALLGIIPEQPSYKHPEKDIFNLSEDATRETDPSLVDVEKVYRGDGPTTDPITHMADLSGAAEEVPHAMGIEVTGVRYFGSAETE